MRFVFFLTLWVVAAIGHTAEGFPLSCQPIAVQEESVVLKAKQSLLVLVHNLSNSDLWITHPVSDPNTSAGWSSHLESGNWSALVVDKDPFELSCIESKPGHEQQIPCAGVLGVCEWTTVKLPAQLKGTFWGGENMSLTALTTYLGGRGFGLPAASQ